MKPNIFLLPIEAVNAYLQAKDGSNEHSPEDAKRLSAIECAEIICDYEAANGFDTPAGAYCPQAFQEEFNNALGNVISSDDYYLRIF